MYLVGAILRQNCANTTPRQLYASHIETKKGSRRLSG